MADATGRRHETRDLSIRAIVSFAVGLAVFGGISNLLLTALFGRFSERQERRDVPPSPLEGSRAAPPEPRLEQNPEVALRELRRREEEELGSFGWVDRDHGVVRIPIDRAIRLVTDRGLPARPAQRSVEGRERETR
jgi:hypothetical protein